jgi:hypothetical protein
VISGPVGLPVRDEGLKVPSPADKPVKAPNPKEMIVMGLITQMPTWACMRPEATASARAAWSLSV